LFSRSIREVVFGMPLVRRILMSAALVTLASRAGESAIFAHTNGRVLVQGGRFDDTRRAIATQDSAVVEELPLETAGLSGLLADLVAAVAGPHLIEAREAMEQWRQNPIDGVPAA
jgi:hypothetical protein